MPTINLVKGLGIFNLDKSLISNLIQVLLDDYKNPDKVLSE